MFCDSMKPITGDRTSHQPRESMSIKDLETTNPPAKTSRANKIRFEGKKNYQPFANRRNQNKPTRWAELQRNWPQVSWDNNLNELNLEDLPEEEKEDAMVLLEDIRKYWFIFQENLKILSTKRVKKNDVSKITKKITKRMLIVMSDASGGLKYSIYGAVAYLRYTYEDKTFGWILPKWPQTPKWPPTTAP